MRPAGLTLNGPWRRWGQIKRVGYFEELTRLYLLTDPTFATKLTAVWHHSSVPTKVADGRCGLPGGTLAFAKHELSLTTIMGDWAVNASNLIFRLQCLALACFLVITTAVGAEAQTTDGVEGIRQRAQQGDAIAQFVLGERYDSGEGVPQNQAKAVKWYRKAADQGYAAAQNNLGVAYEKGEGVPQNQARQ